MMDFKNRVALVTGAGSAKGIGRATGLLLARKGAAVALTDINYDGVKEAVEEIKSEKGTAVGFKLDVSNRLEVEKVVKEILDRFGRIDILVNCAGISLPTRILDISDEEWDRIFNVNLKSVYYLTQAVLPHMKANGYGRIVNISSVAGKRGGGLFGGAHYSASKAAVAGFTKAVAREMAPYGITCNCVAPGVIETNLTGDLLTEEMERERMKTIPMGRKGTPEEVAHTVAFLASEKAGYITGEEVDVNGGMHID